LRFGHDRLNIQKLLDVRENFMTRNVLFLLIIIIILAACGSQTTRVEPSASLPQATAIQDETSEPPATQELTPALTGTPLKVTPTPYTPLATNTPIPTLPATVNGLWMSGIVMGDSVENCPFQMGNMPENVFQALGQLCFTLVPGNEEVAKQLTAVLPGSLIRLTGSLDITKPEPAPFTVTQLDYVNKPYDPMTPLDATYFDEELGISFDYPKGWTVKKNWQGRVTVTSYPENNENIGPGIEYIDPTQFDVAYFLAQEESVEDWIEAEWGGLPYDVFDVSQLQIGQWPVTRVEVSEYALSVYYVVEMKDKIFVFYTIDKHSEEFMARIVATLREADLNK
jgi:hypothetical protein